MWHTILSAWTNNMISFIMNYLYVGWCADFWTRVLFWCREQKSGGQTWWFGYKWSAQGSRGADQYGPLQVSQSVCYHEISISAFFGRELSQHFPVRNCDQAHLNKGAARDGYKNPVFKYFFFRFFASPPTCSVCPESRLRGYFSRDELSLSGEWVDAFSTLKAWYANIYKKFVRKICIKTLLY